MPKLPVPELVIPAPLVDEYGDVVALRDAFAPTEARYRKLHELLKLLVVDADPEAEFVVKGERFTLRITARGFESAPDVPRVRKKLGAAAFLAVVSCTKKALEAFLLKPQIEALCVTSQTGPRKFEPVLAEK